jgi:hypothetical protein
MGILCSSRTWDVSHWARQPRGLEELRPVTNWPPLSSSSLWASGISSERQLSTVTIENKQFSRGRRRPLGPLVVVLFARNTHL